MVKIGEVQELKIISKKGQLTELEYGLEVPFVEKEIGELVEVFVYNDGEDIMASLEKPYLTVGGFETLTVTEINMVGAFCDIGIEKDLFIPYANQLKDMLPNRKYVIHMYLDELTNRLVGTAKLKRFLVQEAGNELSFGQEVDLIVYGESDLGYSVVVNQKYNGLIYESDLLRPILRHGEKIKGYVKPLREDGKIDISLTPVGHKSIEPNAEKIYKLLEEEGGFLPFNDKSDPLHIREKFGVSKKLFKKAIGGLYKERMIKITPEGIQKV